MGRDVPLTLLHPGAGGGEEGAGEQEDCLIPLFSLKVVRNQLAEGGRAADAQRSLYDLVWMGVRDKVVKHLKFLDVHCRGGVLGSSDFELAVQ